MPNLTETYLEPCQTLKIELFSKIFNGLCSLAIFAKHCILMFDRILNTLPPNSSIFIKKVCGYFVTLKITVRSALINIIPHPSLRLFKKIAFLLSIRVITYF